MKNYKSRTERYQMQKRKKTRVIILSLLFIIIGTGGTVAYLTDTTDPLINTFKPAEVKVKVHEEYKDNIKSQIKVENVGNTEVYIRLKLISYRVNNENKSIGGKANIPDFKIGTNWIKHNGFYYYSLPVKPGKKNKTDSLLSSASQGIKLEDYSKNKKDADGGKQVIEVMAEGIQSEPYQAVIDAWGQDVLDNLFGGQE